MPPMNMFCHEIHYHCTECIAVHESQSLVRDNSANKFY